MASKTVNLYRRVNENQMTLVSSTEVTSHDGLSIQHLLDYAMDDFADTASLGDIVSLDDEYYPVTTSELTELRPSQVPQIV